VSEHWTGYHEADGSYKGFIKKYFTRLAAKKASAIVTVTNNLQHKMQQHRIKGNYRVIPNVVDTSVFNYSPVKKQGRFRFLHVSSFEEEQKNVAGLLEVFKRLNKEQAFELFLVGDGPGRKKLEEQAGSLLNRSVFFTGQKFGADLALEFNSADCFVLFSNYENLPVVLLEAMCCGLPIISTDVGGIREWVHDEQGILIEPGDEAALLKAMKEMSASNERYDRKKISDTACISFNYHKIASEFTTVYNEVLKKK
jgi:glycosyltransferase involved in cell wall biosynthesis